MTTCALPGCDRPARSNKRNSTCSEAHKNALYHLQHKAHVDERQVKCNYEKCEVVMTLTNGKNKLYCCDKHKRKQEHLLRVRRAGTEVKPIACAICGKEFTPETIKIVTCSKECQVKRTKILQARRDMERADAVRSRRSPKPAAPKYRKESTLAGTGIKPVKRSAHVVSREQWKMDVLCQAAMLPDYNPHRPEIYIDRVLARKAA